MKTNRLTRQFLAALLLLLPAAAFAQTPPAPKPPAPDFVMDQTPAQLAVPTKATTNNAPPWVKKGAVVFHMSTPDIPNVLPNCEEGLGIASNLMDGTVEQIPFFNGLIGHDHPGPFNWDGLWPYWDRVTFRAGDWDKLAAFMKDVHDKYNVGVSFHVNCTDVNVGLKDYPETQAFFQKLVATKSMYRRDWDAKTNKRDGDPYVPTSIPADLTDPVQIYAIVNYKNYWDSGLAKEVIDAMYAHLPYAPPVMYLDVLTPTGGNLNVGFPDGPLGGSKETQVEGMNKIAEYLHSKGTDLATEGNRPLLGKWATYVWLHGGGFSTDDYSVISGGSRQIPFQHVMGDPGSFNVSPVSSTPDDLAKVRAHYANLLAGKPDDRPMPGLDTWHLSDRGAQENEFDMIPGFNGKKGMGGDPFRGDWVDMVNDFYLVTIQELYFIGKGAWRTAIFNNDGRFHFASLVLTGPDGKESTIPCTDFIPANAPVWMVKSINSYHAVMLETPGSNGGVAHFSAPQAGKYKVRIVGGGSTGGINVYVNGGLGFAINKIVSHSSARIDQTYDVGEVDLKAGDNTFQVDSGSLYVKWSDGTEALWLTPGLGKGFTVKNGDVTFAYDYDRMWPDTWSGQKKIYFFSWDGTDRTWKLPQDWASVSQATLYPLTPDGRGKGIPVSISDRSLAPKLLPQVPYILVPSGT